MNPRRTRLALKLATIVCTAAVPAVILVGVFAPPVATTEADRPVTRSRPTPTTSPSAVPPPDAFGNTLDRPWRPPLGEPTSGASTVETQPSAGQTAALPQRLTLVGTVGESVALIRGPDGTVALVEVGDDVEGADVIAIRAHQVDLRQGGRLIRLQKEPPPAPSDTAIR